MKNIPTFKVNTELQSDLKDMTGIDISDEIEMSIKNEVKDTTPIIVTEDEYKITVRKGLTSPNDFVIRNQYIKAKIIGIERPDGNIDVVDVLGGSLGTCKDKDEFIEKYFVDFV